MALFGEVSTWVVVPIIIALVVGKKLDAHFGTDPYIFLASAAIGFLMTAFGIVRVIKRYMKEIQNIEDQNKK